MTDKEFNNRCIEDYPQHTCKDCKHYKNTICEEFTIEVEEDFTCKLWKEKDK
jgi:hypothetical protein